MDGRSKKFITVLFGLTWFAMLWMCVAVLSTNTKLSTTLTVLKERACSRTCTTQDTVWLAKKEIVAKNSRELREAKIELIAKAIRHSEELDVLSKKLDRLDVKVEEGLQGVYYVQGQIKGLANFMFPRIKAPMTRMVTGKERAFFDDLFNDIKEVEKNNR